MADTRAVLDRLPAVVRDGPGPALPAVLRDGPVPPAALPGEQGAEGESFLAGFLAAFEAVLGTVDREIDAVPALFAVPPVGELARRVTAREPTIQLETAAGFCPGDVVQIEDLRHPVGRAPALVEFKRVRAVRGERRRHPRPHSRSLLPTILRLDAKLDAAHPKGAAVRRVGRPAARAKLSLPVGPPPAPASRQSIQVTGAARLGAERGSVLAIDEGAAIEFVQVVDIEREAITVTPPLAHPHGSERPVALLRADPDATPAPAFRYAERSGAELVIETPARAGERRLELDSLTGLHTGDVLHLHDDDPARVEFARIAALPPERNRRRVLRFALLLAEPLRFSHGAGSAVGVVGQPAASGRLAGASAPGATEVELDPLDVLELGAGDVIRVGVGADVDYGQVVRAEGTTVTLRPALARRHPAGAPVAVLLDEGGGTGFLEWLAGWVGIELRRDRGERWNRELARLAGRIWPLRGTRPALEAMLNATLRGQARARIVDVSNPFQLGLVSTLGVDTVLCGRPHFFWADLHTEQRNSRMYHPDGLAQVVTAAQRTLAREKPAHSYYDLRVHAHTMQLGTDPETDVGARLGDTTLLWSRPLTVPGDVERRGQPWPM